MVEKSEEAAAIAEKWQELDCETEPGTCRTTGYAFAEAMDDLETKLMEWGDM